jgi:hypothetical protein
MELAKMIKEMEDYSKRMPTKEELDGMRDLVKYKLEKENGRVALSESQAVLTDVAIE